MEFLEAEELGVKPAAECTTCKGCRDYNFRRKVLSLHYHQILRRIENEMTKEPFTGKIMAIYPWKPCKERMKDNRLQVRKFRLLQKQG